MNLSRRGVLTALGLSGMGALSTNSAFAQVNGRGSYPASTIRLVVPFAPGSGNDILGRLVAQQLTNFLGQAVVVDNRAGAGGLIGATVVAHAEPDGYVIGMGSSSTLAIAPARMKTPPYNVLTDFAYITLLAKAGYVLVVNPEVPAHSLADLIALAKASPEKYKFSSAGIGTTNHLAGEILNTMAGIKLLHVPYRGAEPATIAVVENEIQITFGPILSVVPSIKTGQLRPLAVTSAQRYPGLPDSPTIAESGFPGYEVVNWYGLLAPAHTPKPVIDRLYIETIKAINSDAVHMELVNEGATVVGSTPDEFLSFIKTEIVRWTKAVADAKLPVI